MNRVATAAVCALLLVSACGQTLNKKLERQYSDCIEAGGRTVHDVEITLDSRGDLVMISASVDAAELVRQQCFELISTGR
mgnify:CR=1 FL=1